MFAAPAAPPKGAAGVGAAMFPNGLLVLLLAFCAFSDPNPPPPLPPPDVPNPPPNADDAGAVPKAVEVVVAPAFPKPALEALPKPNALPPPPPPNGFALATGAPNGEGEDEGIAAMLLLLLLNPPLMPPP